MKLVDISGLKFGRLTVLSRHLHNSTNNKIQWICRCNCGTEVAVIGGNLKSGTTTSCGCFHDEVCSSKNKDRSTHGHCSDLFATRTYRTWQAMKRRCLDSKNHNFSRYGGRGISICENWLNFENFLFDMGERPKGKTIDRIDNNGNYEPKNCRWATPKEQANNRELKC